MNKAKLIWVQQEEGTGLFTEEEVQELLLSRRIRNDTPARLEDDTTWARVGDLVSQPATPGTPGQGAPNLPPLPSSQAPGGPPPAQAGPTTPISPTSRAKHWGKWIAAASLLAACYLAWPYWVAYSVRQAVRKGRGEVLNYRINYVELKQSLAAEIAHSITLTDHCNDHRAPVISRLDDAEILTSVVRYNLDNTEHFLHLFQALRLSDSPAKPRAGTLAALLSNQRPLVRGEEYSLTVSNANTGSLGYTFFTSPTEFCVTLKAVTIGFGLLAPDYSTTTPIELEASIPRVKVFFHLDHNTWRLHRVKLPDTNTCRIYAPWIEQDDLAGTWRVKGAPQWEFDVGGEQDVFARWSRYNGDDSLTLTFLRISDKSQPWEIWCEDAADRSSARVVFRKRRDGQVEFVDMGSTPARLERAGTRSAWPVLRGVWKCPQAGLVEMDYDERGTVPERRRSLRVSVPRPNFNPFVPQSEDLCGYALREGLSKTEEGLISLVNKYERTLELSFQPQEGGIAGATIQRRLDGALFFGWGASAHELRCYPLSKVGTNPLPPWETLSTTNWETDRLLKLTLAVPGGSSGSGNFRVKNKQYSEYSGRISNLGAQGFYHLPLEWTFTAPAPQPPARGRRNGLDLLLGERAEVKGTGSIERDRQGRWRLRLDSTKNPPSGRAESALRLVAMGSFADGQWYDLRYFQPAPTQMNAADKAVVAPTNIELKLQVRDVPRGAKCYITMTPSQQVPEKIESEFQRAFKADEVIKFEAPPSVAGCPFDHWDKVDSPVQECAAWVTNTFERTIVAHYKRWEGVWKTTEGTVIRLNQHGDKVTGQQEGGSASLSGTIADGERLHANLRGDGDVIYQISVTMHPESESFSGVIFRAVRGGENSERKDFSAERIRTLGSP